MKVVFHEFFYPVYTSDPAAAGGRLEAIIDSLPTDVEMVTPAPATEEQIRLAHTDIHIQDVKRDGLYEISAMAAGGAIHAARIGLTEPEVEALKRGVTATLEIVPAQAPDQTVSIEASLAGFTAAYEAASELRN